jgi:hypothetical protein
MRRARDTDGDEEIGFWVGIGGRGCMWDGRYECGLKEGVGMSAMGP